jgi:hypothetical protein
MLMNRIWVSSAAVLVACLFAMPSGWHAQAQDAEKNKDKEKDSIELVVRGCLKGRGLQAEDVSLAKDEEQIPAIQARAFRVNGTREILDEIKRQNKRYIEVTGLVKRSALMAPGTGITVGRTRITVMPGAGDPSRMRQPTPNAGVVHIDATAVRVVAESCERR